MKNDIKLTNNFWLWEFFDQKTYEENSEFVLEGILDPKIVSIAQHIRDWLEIPITINSWKAGGKYNLSGFRPKDSVIGGRLSQHRFGRAIDIKIDGMESIEVQRFVRRNYKQLRKFGLTVMEDATVGWTHLDCRYTGKDYLVEVKP